MEQENAWRMTGDMQVEHGKGDPFAAAMRATRMPMIITDPRRTDNPIVFANEAFLKLSGYSRDAVIGENCRFLQGADTDPAAIASIREAVRDRRDVALDILNYRRDGSTFWNALYMSPVANEAGELLYYFASLLDVTERKRGELDASAQRDAFEKRVDDRTAELKRTAENLQAALSAKETLLHEVDHRVKNNLQMIASMILMQTRAIPDESVRNSLKSMLARVEALSTVHRRLYQSDDVSTFDVAEFTRDLSQDLVGATGRSDIKLDLDLQHIQVPAAKAAPVALILNELITNVLKHAFPEGRNGVLRVALKQADRHFHLAVEDDGVGISGEASGKSFGTSLIRTLGRQLHATVEWVNLSPGTRVGLVIPIEQPRANKGG